MFAWSLLPADIFFHVAFCPVCEELWCAAALWINNVVTVGKARHQSHERHQRKKRSVLMSRSVYQILKTEDLFSLLPNKSQCSIIQSTFTQVQFQVCTNFTSFSIRGLLSQRQMRFGETRQTEWNLREKPTTPEHHLSWWILTSGHLISTLSSQSDQYLSSSKPWR